MGIDPGTRIVGYGIIDAEGTRFKAVAFGAVRIKEAMAFSDRLKHIYTELGRLIDEYKPAAVATEEIFYHKSVPSSVKIGEGRGVAILAAAMKNIPVEIYPSTMIKKSVTGNGHASKEQVQEMVRRIFCLEKAPSPSDASDALAIAVCHAHRAAFGLKTRPRD
jgi:crossover junction endodeoxyribonuclease RuvC